MWYIVPLINTTIASWTSRAPNMPRSSSSYSNTLDFWMREKQQHTILSGRALSRSLAAMYCAISFNSAWVVTRDPKYRFGTSATNELWRDTSKNSALKTEFFENSAFFAPPREIWP
jgi:hypothetical protein